MKRYKRKFLKNPVKRVSIILLLLILGIMVFRTSMSSIKQDEFPLLNKLINGTNKADTSLGWNLILINKENYVPDNYEVALTELSNGEKVDSRIYPELQEMFDDARTDGLHLFVREGYRTPEEQQQIMDDKIKEYQESGHSKSEAKVLAEECVAIPGTSEHQLGISVDINADTSQCSSDAVYAWLDENAHKYGFIKRYAADKTDITGISNEPWHYRYVGKTAAKEMKEKGVCLEEYIKQLES